MADSRNEVAGTSFACSDSTNHHSPQAREVARPDGTPPTDTELAAMGAMAVHARLEWLNEKEQDLVANMLDRLLAEVVRLREREQALARALDYIANGVDNPRAVASLALASSSAPKDTNAN